MNKSYFEKREFCPVCNHQNNRLLYSSAYSQKEIKQYLNEFYLPQGGVEHEFLKYDKYELCECVQCGLIFQKYIPNDALMYKLYEEWINPEMVFNKITSKYGLDYYLNSANEIVTVLKFLNRPVSEIRILDFGMGWGKWALLAKSFGCKVYGIELSKSRIEYAQNNGIDVITWEDLPNYQFDFINTEQVFEHISDPKETLGYLKKRLTKDGIIKISVPNGNHSDDIIKKMDWTAPKGTEYSLNVVAPLEHINCFKNKTLLFLGDLCGLSLVNIPKVYEFKELRECAENNSFQGIKQKQKQIVKDLLRKVQNKFKILKPKRTVVSDSTYLFFKQK